MAIPMTASRRSLAASIGREIRKARLSHRGGGMSQRLLADLSGVSQSSICGWERGDTEIPLYALIDIASVLEVDPLSLLGRCAGSREVVAA